MIPSVWKTLIIRSNSYSAGMLFTQHCGGSADFHYGNNKLPEHTERGGLHSFYSETIKYKSWICWSQWKTHTSFSWVRVSPQVSSEQRIWCPEEIIADCVSTSQTLVSPLILVLYCRDQEVPRSFQAFSQNEAIEKHDLLFKSHYLQWLLTATVNTDLTAEY